MGGGWLIRAGGAGVGGRGKRAGTLGKRRGMGRRLAGRSSPAPLTPSATHEAGASSVAGEGALGESGPAAVD